MKNKIYNYLLHIPYGKVVTYSQIASYLGNRKLCRYVGNQLHKNENGDVYPCFKVVNKKGELSINYAFGGIEEQKKRLEKEGIIVEGNKVDLKKYQYLDYYI